MLRWPQSVEIKGFFGKKRCMFRTRPARPESVGHDAAPGQAGARNGDAGGRPFVCFQRGGRHGKKPPHRSRRNRMPTPAAAISSAVCIGRKEKRSPTAMKKRMSILPPCRRFQGCALAGRAVSARHIRNVAPRLGRRRFFAASAGKNACTEQARGNVRREKARHEQRGAGGRLCACFQRGAGMAGSPGRSGGPGAWAKRRSHAEGTGTRNKRPADVPAGATAERERTPPAGCPGRGSALNPHDKARLFSAKARVFLFPSGRGRP